MRGRISLAILLLLLVGLSGLLVSCSSSGGSTPNPNDSYLDLRAHARGADGRDVYSSTVSVRVIASTTAAVATRQVSSAELPLSPEPNLTPGGLRRVVIGYKAPPSPKAVSALASKGAYVKYSYSLIPAVAAAVTEDQLKALQQDPNVEYVGDDVIKHTSAQELPWGVDAVDAEQAWGEGEDALHVTRPQAAGQGAEVAVIDTGAQLDHPDLAANIIGGWDVQENDATPQDTFGHGTHTAGIVAAVDNQIGVIGTAPKASLYIVRVGITGSFTVSDEIAGIEKAVQHGSDIISMSISGPQGAGEAEACQAAWDAGALLVGAAGNNGGTVQFPAAFDTVIAVGAVDQDLHAPSWSCRGPQLELAAPGVAIRSTALNNTYDSRDGTSFAVPHVSGAAAVVMGLFGTNNAETRQILQQTATDLGDPGRDDIYGFGLLDVAQAAGVVPEDQYEPDNSSPQAVAIAIGTPQSHTLYPEGDQDWMRFEGTFGDKYAVETITQSGVAAAQADPVPDTYLEVRNPAGELVASNDDKTAGTKDARVEFSALADGTYRILVRVSSQAAADQRTGPYQVTLSRLGSGPLTVQVLSVSPPSQVPSDGSVTVQWSVSGISPDLVSYSNIEYWRRGSSQHLLSPQRAGLGSFSVAVPASP